MTEAPEPKKQKMTPTLTTKLTSDKVILTKLKIVLKKLNYAFKCEPP